MCSQALRCTQVSADAVRRGFARRVRSQTTQHTRGRGSFRPHQGRWCKHSRSVERTRESSALLSHKTATVRCPAVGFAASVGHA
eukprot:408923-Pleurochrysis_carterae.AAC.1